jgi:hypothetical protein
MNIEKVNAISKHPIISGIAILVAGLILTGVVHRIYKEPPSVSIASPSPEEIKRQEQKERLNKLTELQSLVSRMTTEINAEELQEFRRDAVNFRNDGDRYDDVLDLSGLVHPDNIDAISRAVHAQLFIYAQQCGSDITRKSKNWEFCASVADFYIKPSLEVLSTAVQRRSDKEKASQ